MRKWMTWLKKCKKGFTLMECVCAIAIVGLLSAMILPLTSGAIRSMKVSDSLRTAARNAAAKNATVATDLKKNTNTETMYVTVKYQFTNSKGEEEKLQAQSAFVFTKSEEKGDADIQITYYDLKYGNEEEDPKK